jgi:hypothetical protein
MKAWLGPWKNYLLYGVTSQMSGQRCSTKCKDYGYDNVLRGEGYDTAQREVKDQYETMVEW